MYTSDIFDLVLCGEGDITIILYKTYILPIDYTVKCFYFNCFATLF